MLRMYCVQHWFNLADEACEEALLDSQALCAFVGIDLGRERVPDATTLLRFRRLLERHELGAALFAEIGEHLQEEGAFDWDGHDCGCDADQCAVLDEEPREGARSGDAPDEEGWPVVLRDEEAHRSGQPHRAGTQCGG